MSVLCRYNIRMPDIGKLCKAALFSLVAFVVSASMLPAARAQSGDGSTAIIGGPGGHENAGAARFLVAAPMATAKPTVTGIVNDAGFTPGGAISPGSWVAIFGTDLAPAGDSRKWNETTEIVNGKLPGSLDGTSVTVNGKPAVVEFIQPTQVNIQPPDDTAVGPVQVVVSTAGGASDAFTVNYAQFAPGLFPGASPYIVAQHADNSYVTTAAPAKPGEVIILWGTGFGPANPAVPAGQAFSGANPLANKVTVTIGGQNAQVDFAGVVGAGLVQINVHVPSSINSGDAGVVATVSGVSTQAAGAIPVNSPAQALHVVAAPASLTFTAVVGGSTPGVQTVSIAEASGAALTWQATRTTQSGGSWLNISPTSGDGKTVLSVSVSPSSLGIGTYQGSISLTAQGVSGTAATIPVTLTVQGPQVVIAPASLTFNAFVGGITPATQTVSITEVSGAALFWQAAPSGESWLSINPSSGTGKTLLTVSISPAGLAAGTLQGAVSLNVAGTVVTIPVTLNVLTPQVVFLPASLTFAAAFGGSPPAAQTVTVTEASGVAFTWRVAETPGSFLKFTPSSGNGKGTFSFSVSASPNGLAVGPYLDTLSLFIGGSAAPAAGIPVTFAVR